MKYFDNVSDIIRSVTTPLGYLVMAYLIMNSAFCYLISLKQQEFQTLLIYSMIIFTFLFLGIVVFLAAFRPEALRGHRPLRKEHAYMFANDLRWALNGAMSNLKPAEIENAWTVVEDVVKTSGQDAEQDPSYTQFCIAVASKLKSMRENARVKYFATKTITRVHVDDIKEEKASPRP